MNDLLEKKIFNKMFVSQEIPFHHLNSLSYDVHDTKVANGNERVKHILLK